jgi:zeaxanthin glucosyltransferase
VAVPLAHDQPGVAARVKAHGACVVVPLRKLNAARLRKAVMMVLQDVRYREAAQALQRTIQRLDGPERAADIIEQVLQISAQPTVTATSAGTAATADTPEAAVTISRID